MRNGWLCEKFVECDEVTGVDVADAAISDAKRRVSNATFFAAVFARSICLRLDSMWHLHSKSSPMSQTNEGLCAS